MELWGWSEEKPWHPRPTLPGPVTLPLTPFPEHTLGTENSVFSLDLDTGRQITA